MGICQRIIGRTGHTTAPDQPTDEAPAITVSHGSLAKVAGPTMFARDAAVIALDLLATSNGYAETTCPLHHVPGDDHCPPERRSPTVARSLDGGEGPSAARIRGYAVSFARVVSPVPVRFVDERLTTVTAANALRASGRSARHQRSVIDQVAAVTILEHALETER